MTRTAMVDTTTAGGFRSLRVVAKIRESATITSFHLEPVELDGWQDYQPGQFLVFRLPGDGSGEAGFDLRNYSVSSFGKPGRYRISVKREAAPSDGLPGGRASNFLHDKVRVGDELLAAGPRGAFVLDETSHRPVVLISGGVGQTPLVAMFQRLAASSERIAHFIHACDNGDLHAFGDEMRATTESRAGLHLHICYRSPTDEDRLSDRFHSEGVVTRELLQSILPIDDYDFYLCGPPPFMKAVHGALMSLGVSRTRIAYEFFGPATVLDETATSDEDGISAPLPEAVEDGVDQTVVEFRRSGVRAAWDADSYSLLDFAEAQGLSPDFSCRAGVCSTCKSRLVSGEVEYFEDPLDEPEPGEVLLCCSRPLGPVVIDI